MHSAPIRVSVRDIHEPHARALRCEQRERRFRFRPLKRDQRSIELFDVALIPKLGSQMRFVRFLAGCIDNKHQMIPPVSDHQVIKNAAKRVREEGIAQASRG